MATTLKFKRAKHIPKLAVVVVFPTLPFPEVITTTVGALLNKSACGSIAKWLEG
ncbi:hypothetical protein Mapa_007749 [Marchantia paleacea]|nr:hypothetical protein Mapa_007749 [Marchantia paleacea]